MAAPRKRKRVLLVDDIELKVKAVEMTPFTQEKWMSEQILSVVSSLISITNMSNSQGQKTLKRILSVKKKV